MEPRVQADLGFTLAAPSPVRRGPLLGTYLQAGSDDQHHEEDVEEVLPSQPGREPDGCPFGKVVLAGVCLQEVLQRLSSQQPADAQHGERSDNDKRNDGSGAEAGPYPMVL